MATRVVGGVVCATVGGTAVVVVGFGGRADAASEKGAARWYGRGGRGGFAGGGGIVLLVEGDPAVVGVAAVEGVVASVLVTPGM